ncbi:DNA polymerase III subunit delta' [bacterium]|nr:DNA polymerase III subunit delta' [bacterium]
MIDLDLVRTWQKEAWNALDLALSNDHLPHAIVLISPGDVGERELAERLADRLVCEEPGKGLECCGKCSGCHLRSQGTHPDVYYVRPVGRMRAINPESMGEMMASLQTKSLKGRAKVVIIEQAEALTRESANKFLKTLEEPSSRTYFILLTTRGERLLPTIRSRCQIIRLLPLSEKDMRRVCEEELKLGGSDADFVIRLSRGRRSKALQLAPSLSEYKKDAADLLEIYGLRDRALPAIREFSVQKYRAMRQLRDDWELEIAKAKKKLSEDLKDADPSVKKVELQKLEDAMVIENAELLQDMRADCYELLTDIWRDIWIVKKGAGAESVLHAFLLPQLERVADIYTEEEIIRNINEINLVRGPAVFLAMQFDVVLQGLLARHVAPAETRVFLRNAIKATGL